MASIAPHRRLRFWENGGSYCTDFTGFALIVASRRSSLLDQLKTMLFLLNVTIHQTRFFGLNFCESCSVDWPLHRFVSLLMAEFRRSPSLVLAEEVSACLDVCSEIAGRSCT
ncbi:hypothetical protein F2Q69_00013201 [Brassica cretica]|uniref:Uncharacterized protein n=1 Tax=Brassica cretica TaxID=69181 RepID=A0A8S9R9A6_BRACR|nr:hypothetical protein F2Q69_00013201 [Brassica cretica]